jgi:cytochrome b pre-mRNA-processing protein 3
MFKALFPPSPAQVAGRALYAQVSAAARQPVFYLEGKAPDTAEGRFELYLLHLVLALHRLKGQGPAAKAVSQRLFDSFLRGLDDGLREMGVGDLSVGKKMRRLGEAIYGRLHAYDDALAGPDAAVEVRALVLRTLYADMPLAPADFVAAYVLDCVEALQAQPLSEILEGRMHFPQPRHAETAA